MRSSFSLADALHTPSLCSLPPQSVKQSKVTVDVCSQRQGGCAASTALVKLDAPLTDAAAVKLFAPLKDVKVLEFSTMLGAFSGFEAPEDQQRFQRRIKEYGGIWCCIAAHPVRSIPAGKAPLPGSRQAALFFQGKWKFPACATGEPRLYAPPPLANSPALARVLTMRAPFLPSPPPPAPRPVSAGPHLVRPPLGSAAYGPPRTRL